MATVTEQRSTTNWMDTDRRVRHPLQAVRGYIRTFVLLEGLGLALVYITLAFWIGLFLDWGLFQAFAFDWVQELQELTAGQGNGYWLRLSLLAIFVAGLVTVIFMKTVMRLFREFSDRSMALILERRFPRELGDRLITAVELADPKLAVKYSYSLPMIQKTIREAAERVERLPVRDVFNWARLRRIFALFGVLSLGLYLLVGVSICTGDSIRGARFDPTGFAYRFNDTAGIWAERNLLLMDSYWPRSSYLELIGFQDTPEHPGDMRVGRDEQRPPLQARAIAWVMADHHVQGGWRPMKWNDLGNYIDPSLLARVTIPSDWPDWAIDLDDVKDRVNGSAFPPESWQGLSSGAIRKQMQDPAMKKAAQSANMTQTMGALLDWHTWTVDRVANEWENEKVQSALLAGHADSAKALEEILDELTKLAEKPSMSRKLRQLEVPAKVWVRSRGVTTKNDAESQLQLNNKYVIGLADIKESVRFTVIANDYYTPYRNITLRPPPALVKMTVDKEEPAYIYFRLQGEQSPLKGKKRATRNHLISVTGNESTMKVPFGTDVTLTAHVEPGRRLKDAWISPPDKVQLGGSQVPDVAASFSPGEGKEGEDQVVVHLKHLVRAQEFTLYIRDLDSVKGKHQVRIVVDDDQPAELLDVELDAVLRNPRFRTDAGKSASGPSWASDAFLITPDALLPIKGTVKDDYGLTKVEWKYEFEQVEIELQGDMPTRPKAPGAVSGNRTIGRAALVASSFQFLPGEGGMALYGPAYWAWMTRMLVEDLKTKSLSSEGEESRMLESFTSRLRAHGGALALDDLERKLNNPASPRELYRKHSWKGARGTEWTDDEDAFDVRKYLPKLKSPDPQRLAQLHYLLKVSISATDNNIETGPSVSRMKKPLQFLIVSPTELLAQISLEEELLSERLESVFQKLGNAKTILGEQFFKLSEPEPKFAEIALRIDQTTRGISEGFGKTREVLTDFTRIRDELYVNRVLGEKYVTVDFQIVKPLEKIVDQSADPAFRGEFPTVEDMVQALLEEVNGDAQELARGGKNWTQTVQARRDSLVASQKKLEGLMTSLNFIMTALQSEINEQLVLNRAIAMERGQRQLAQRWQALHDQKLRELLEHLIKPGSK